MELSTGGAPNLLLELKESILNRRGLYASAKGFDTLAPHRRQMPLMLYSEPLVVRRSYRVSSQKGQRMTRSVSRYLTFALLISAPALVCAVTVVQCRDEDGNVSFRDRCPPNIAKTGERPSPHTPVSAR